MKKRQKETKACGHRGLFRTRAFKNGGYCIVLSAIVTAIVVAVNIFAAQLPSEIMRQDLTGEQLYTLSEQTKTLIGGLSKDVTVMLVAQSGSEDSTIQEVLERYAALSDRLTVRTVDPVVYPKTVEQYASSSSIAQNSLIVASGDRSQVIDYSDIYVTDYSNYYYTGSYDVSFDLESALTSAVDAVTSDDLPKLYTLTGHGEGTLSESLLNAVAKENMIVESLSLLSSETVPEDAGAVMILSPQNDLSDVEATQLLKYLDEGGKVLLITDYVETAMPNLLSVCQAYGMTAAEGVVCEADMNYCLRGYTHYLLPDIQAHAITQPLIDNRSYVLMPVAHGIRTLSSYRDTLSVTPLLTTTDGAYAKADAYTATTLEKEEGDEQGPFSVGAVATESVEGGEACLIWLSTAQFLNEDVNRLVAGGNEDFFLNALGYLCERESSISIRSKSLMQSYLTIPSGTASLLSVAITVVLPLLVLITGIVVCVRRRRR